LESYELPIVPIGVRNAPFTLELIARDVPFLQFLREFTRNGIEAIEAFRASADPHFRGEVIWTYDRNLYDLTGQKKLVCIDTGVGMSAEELPVYVNELAASGKAQGLAENYGIGAKVSAAHSNPRGLIYCTWQHGSGSMVELGRDSTGVWGMRQHQLADGSIASVVPLDDAGKPPELVGLDHGTMVVFLGRSDEQDTTLPPPELENRDKWISKALNQRFYDLPDYLEVKVLERKLDGSEYLRAVRGQRHFLEQHTIATGVTAIEGARVRWRILDDKHKERAKQAGIWASTGHGAALFQHELLELTTAARGGYRRVQDFGIRFGYERVILYIEPDLQGRTVTTDTARARVLIDGEPLPWDHYAEAFEANMPAELRTFQEEIASGSSAKDHRTAIRDRLNKVRELFKITRYRPNPDGHEQLDQPNLGGKPATHSDKPKRPGGSPGGGGGRAGNIYALFEKRGGENGDRINTNNLPDIEPVWVSVDDSTRAAPHLEDRAARYDHRHNRLEINADFRAYRDLIQRWSDRYPSAPGASTVVSDCVAQWWEQALIETVLGVLALRGSPYWSERVITEALSEVALSAAVMQRYHLDVVVRRELAKILGAIRTAA
jgi:hypothetical protein